MDSTAKLGSGTTIISFLFGNILHLENHSQDQIIFWLQSIAFTISIIVGILTACYYIKKLRQKTKQ